MVGKRKNRQSTASSSSFEDALKAQREALANEKDQSSAKSDNDKKLSVKLKGYHFDEKTNRYFKVAKDDSNVIKQNVSSMSNNQLSSGQQYKSLRVHGNSFSLLSVLHKRSYANTTRQIENVTSSLINILVPPTIRIKYVDATEQVVNDSHDFCYHSVFGLTLATTYYLVLILPSSSVNSTALHTRIATAQSQPPQYFDLRPFLSISPKSSSSAIKSIMWIKFSCFSSSSSSSFLSNASSDSSNEPSVNDLLAVVSTSTGRDYIHIFNFIPVTRNGSLHARYEIKLFGKLAIGNTEVHSIAVNHRCSNSSCKNTLDLHVHTDKFIKNFSLKCSRNDTNSLINATLPNPLTISLNSPIVSSNVINDTTCIGGQRNGSLVLIDSRVNSLNASHSALSSIAKMSACIDQIMSLDSSTSSLLLALDVIGKMAIYDIRMPNVEYLSIVCPSRTFGPIPVRNRRFWLPSSSHWSNSSFTDYRTSSRYTLAGFVVTPHAQAQPQGLCVYSLTEPNHLLHVIPFPQLSSAGVTSATSISSSVTTSVGTANNLVNMNNDYFMICDLTRVKLATTCHRSNIFTCSNTNTATNLAHDPINSSAFNDSVIKQWESLTDGLYGMIDNHAIFQGIYSHNHYE